MSVRNKIVLASFIPGLGLFILDKRRNAILSMGFVWGFVVLWAVTQPGAISIIFLNGGIIAYGIQLHMSVLLVDQIQKAKFWADVEAEDEEEHSVMSVEQVIETGKSKNSFLIVCGNWFFANAVIWPISSMLGGWMSTALGGRSPDTIEFFPVWLVIGGATGLAQWLAIRRYVANGLVWILGSAVGVVIFYVYGWWIGGLALGTIQYLLLRNQSITWWWIPGNLIASGSIWFLISDDIKYWIVQGISFGLITGIVLYLHMIRGPLKGETMIEIDHSLVNPE